MDHLRRWLDVAALTAGVAALMMLVRPGSQGPTMVKNIGEAFASAVRGAIGADLTGVKPFAPSPRKGSGGSKKGAGSGDSTPWWMPEPPLSPGNPLPIPLPHGFPSL